MKIKDKIEREICCLKELLDGMPASREREFLEDSLNALIWALDPVHIIPPSLRY